jgi:hypothetical protein
MICDYFSSADLSVAGIAADIAGAVVLGLGFSFKRPERIREEVPRTVTAPTTPGHIGVPFPQAQAESMVRQRAEARWGMTLLVIGFLMQAAVYFFAPSGHLEGGREKALALVLALLVWAIAWLGMKTVVAADEWTTLSRLGDGAGPVGTAFGETLEMRGGRQVEVGALPPPPRFLRLLRRARRR